MRRGIYIVANNKVKENAIALLNSIRLYDSETEIFLIPFNDDYEDLATILQERHQVQIFPDLEFLEQFTGTIANTFDRDFLALPNKMRKLIAWFGPLDEFLYIDTDIIVFEKIADTLNYLSESSFICCDYHYKGRNLKDIFSPLVKEQNIFSEQELQDVFNSGFWASKKEAISYAKMIELLQECAAHREYFDFSSQTTDQPILNYLVLKAIPKRLNLVKLSESEPGSWAGTKHFQEKDYILYDQQQPLRYLHWAGIAMKPGAPYQELWEHYRYLNESKPVNTAPVVEQQSSWQKLTSKVTSKLRGTLRI
jgi:lipopolysaccharide biosynthesis glycosyltransferase